MPIQPVQQLTWDYILLLVYMIVTAGFLYIRWQWISKALSDADIPSSKRLTGFWAIQTLMLCEVFYVVKKGDLPLNHIIAWLAFAAVCLGFAPILLKFIDAWKGSKPQP